MSIPTFDNKKDGAFLSFQTQVKMFGRRHGFKKMSTGEQLDVDVMTDGVDM